MIATNAGTKRLPVLNHPLSDRGAVAGVPLSVDLASAFGTEPIDDQVIRFTSRFKSGGVPVVMDIALFSNRTPVTRQNFLDYVTNGSWVDSFIHRSVPGFVIQGGGFRLDGAGNIAAVPTAAPIVNEFGVSNTLGTVSMAKSGGDPNSATSQWFVSLGENSGNLDSQNGGFTVFGQVTQSTFGVAQVFGDPNTFPISDFSATFGGTFSDVPLFYYDGGVILFTGVTLAPLPEGEAGESSNLTYTVVSNSNPTVATATIQPNGVLGLSPIAGKTGTVVVTVRATDSVGNTVDDSFALTVIPPDTYTTWASRNTFPAGQSAMEQNPDGDAWNNLQEYAFLGNPATSDLTGQSVSLGATGAAPNRYQTLTFPVRKSAQDLIYTVEANDSLSGAWTEIWKSSDGFLQTRVISTVDQTDRTVVTIQDNRSPIGIPTKRFLRVKVVQQ
jgi:cyclophilin family peptidyl-prolyl cis-trans isomerase